MLVVKVFKEWGLVVTGKKTSPEMFTWNSWDWFISLKSAFNKEKEDPGELKWNKGDHDTPSLQNKIKINPKMKSQKLLMSSIKPRQGIQFKITSVVHVQVEPIFTLPRRRFPLKEVNDCITQKSILFSFVVFSLPPHQQTAFCFCAEFHLFVYYCIPGTCNNTSFYVYSNTPLR